MKFSENWLRELVEIPAGRDALVERLTMAGLEVESVVEHALSAEVVVGEIVDCAPHPDAERLRVCRVADGRAQHVVVCGAPNARLGLKAPLARIGARLPGGLEIARATLRGVESHGMLCSAKELGLGDEAGGLLELAPDARVGQPLAEHYGLPDATLELKLTPNRPDCLGLLGLATEVGALFRTSVREPLARPVPARRGDVRDVSLEAPAACPRYVGRVLRGIDPAARTPLWMRERLRRAGLRSVSAVVDCTNYVMLELGQPMHAFDLAGVDAIVVRHARAGETLKLLDGREVTLDPDVLVIADRGRAIALAGIMGGFDSRVVDGTRDLFLEAAHFAPEAIAGRARRLGLHTDASHRFERGVDPELPRRAMERLSGLLLEIAGGECGPVLEVSDAAQLPRRPAVRLRAARLDRVLGIGMAREAVEEILTRLGLAVDRDAHGWHATPPSRRFDLAIEEDLIEEIVRVHGYERVPTHAPAGALPRPAVPEGEVPLRTLRTLLAGRDYAEHVALSFVPAALLERWGLAAGAQALSNPLSAELGVMRTSLLPGLVEALRYNLSRQQSRIRLFETGRVFSGGGGAATESDRIAGVVCGRAEAEQWGLPAREVDFFDLKGDVEHLLASCGPADLTFDREALPEWLHPGRAARVLRDGRPVGWLGMLAPVLRRTLDLPVEVLVFEFELTAIRARPVPRAGELSRFPSVRRDLAVVVSETVAAAALEASVRSAIGARLKEFVLFDQYAGKALPEGCRSLAIGLILQDESRTLTDQDADRDVAAALDALERGHGARLRS